MAVKVLPDGEAVKETVPNERERERVAASDNVGVAGTEAVGGGVAVMICLVMDTVAVTVAPT